MDVDAAPGKLCREAIRENLHVTGEHDELGAGGLDRLPNLRFLLHLCLAGDRKMVEGNVAKIDMSVGFSRIIGNDRDGLHQHFATAPTIEQIDQAMIEPRDHERDLSASLRWTHCQIHAEIGGDFAETRADRLGVRARLRGVKLDPHEEIAGHGVVELLRVENVEAAVEQGRRDFRYDPRPVGAGEGEDVTGSGHWVSALSPTLSGATG